MFSVKTFISALIVNYLSASGSAGYNYENNVILRSNTGRLTHEALTDIDDVSSCEYAMCESSPTYPEDEILALLENANIMPSYFGTISTSVNIHSRFPEIKSKVCEHKDVKRTPRRMLDWDSKPRFIANIKNYRQEIQFTVCNEPVNKSKFNVLLEQNVTCKQAYTYHELVVYEKNITKNEPSIEFVPFKIPSACIPLVL